LGYGFVVFEKLTDAEKAVAELDKKEIDGRQINVEIARPQAPASTPKKTRRSRNAKMPANGDGAFAAAEEADGGDVSTRIKC
jgi:RNA recognition motif-containing protein